MTWNIVIKINKLDVSDVEYCKFYGKNVKVKRRYDVENRETTVKRRRNLVWGGGNYILKIDPPITPLIHVD